MRTEELQQHELDVIDAVVKGGGESRPDDAALVDFALLVRSVRPVPSFSEGEAIDVRVRGLKKPRRSGGSLRGQLIAACASLFIVMAAVTIGLSETGGDEKADDMSAPAAGSSIAVSRDGKAAPEQSMEKAAAQAVAPGVSTSSKRDVATNTQITLATEGSEIENVSDDVFAITDRAGGFVQSSEVSGGAGTDGGATFVLMIPSARYDSAIASLSELAHVRSRHQSTEDITATVKRSDKRLQRARTRVTKLERELRAAPDAQRSELRAKLAQARRAEARAERSVARNNLRANFVPVDLTLEASSAAANADKSPLARAVDIAWSALQGIAAVLVIAVAVLAPFAILGAAAWAWLRQRRRRAAERVLSASARPQAQSE